MRNLEKGTFFGVSRKEIRINGLTFVESAYHGMDSCPWHYHENAYFAFTTAGSLVESYKRKEMALRAGSLMYHHSQEPHCNSRYAPYVAALHVDIDSSWFERCGIQSFRPEGFMELHSPDLKIAFTRLLLEARYGGSERGLGMESLIVTAFNGMLRLKDYNEAGKPAWQNKVKELLYARYDENMSLAEIAAAVHLHPVYLCQQFPKIFDCTLGEYVRKIKIEKAAELLLNDPFISLTSLAYTCGFADQSHFIRLFKKHAGLTPLAFRKQVGCR